MKMTLYYKFNDKCMVNKESIDVIYNEYPYTFTVKKSEKNKSIEEIYESRKEDALYDAALAMMLEEAAFIEKGMK